jgi:hypothetical protein
VRGRADVHPVARYVHAACFGDCQCGGTLIWL